MIPSDVHMDSLRAQLEDDAVAFDTPNPANFNLEDVLHHSLSISDTNQIDPVGVVIMENTPPQIADLRDIAQDLLDATGFDTIVVRTPVASAAVSENLTRFQIETAQRAMMAQQEYGAGLRAFIDAAQTTTLNWPVIFLLVVLAVACVVAVTVLQTRRHITR